MDSEVGLRELRQNASDLVRRAESGERVTVTVAGRPAAVLTSANERRWQSWSSIAEVFDAPLDIELVDDLHRIREEVRDPWSVDR